MMKIKVAPAILGVFVSLFLVSCKSKEKEDLKNDNKKKGPLAVEAYVVKSSALSSSIEVPGSILPFETTEIRSEISGRVVSLFLNEGAFVKKGSLLVKLFDQDLQAQLKKLQVQLQIAEKTAERQKELLKISGISQQEFDLSQLQVNNLKADIELVKVNISKTEIKAPFDGKLGLKNISLGAYISPSLLLTNISQVSQLKLQFNVPEKYSSLVRTQQNIQFQLDGTTQDFSAKVIAAESSIEENTRSLAVRSIITSHSPFLVPGAFAKVRMILGKEDNAIMIPSQAVIPIGRKKQVIVFKNGKAVFTDIITGVRDATNIQVQDGLRMGDTVVTTGLLFLKPDAEIKIAKIQ